MEPTAERLVINAGESVHIEFRDTTHPIRSIVMAGHEVHKAIREYIDKNYREVAKVDAPYHNIPSI